MSAAVTLQALGKTYGSGETAIHALRGVDLEVDRGEFVVVLGPSGSGKTTLLNLVGALEPPTEGRITVDGVDLAALDEEGRTAYRLRSVGFVFQFYNLVPTLTALENVALIAELTGPAAEARSRSVLETLGLAERADHFPAQLSGGEQQRVSIARGLVKEPPLLLCDEPTGALDVATGVQILRLLRDAAAVGRTVLLVTHNTTIAGMADRVVELKDGRVVRDERVTAVAAPEELDW